MALKPPNFNIVCLLALDRFIQSFHQALLFKPLLSTRGGPLAGTTSVENFWTGGVFGTPRRFNPDRTLYRGNGSPEVLAASISGTVSDGNQSNQMQVVLVADADVLADPFFNIRSRGPTLTFHSMSTT